METNKKNIKDNKVHTALRSLGFFFPMNETELDNFNELYKDYNFELMGNEFTPEDILNSVKKEIFPHLVVKSNNAKKKSNQYFKRAVLAAEIASQLYNEPTFGHVKFQKLVFLCEENLNMSTSERYTKQVAGPYDRRFMHTIDNEFKKQKWFKVEQEGAYNKFTYTPLDNLTHQKLYYDRYFSRFDHIIKYIIELFRFQKTDFVEIIATLYACWKEAIIQKEVVSKEIIIDKFYKWSDAKLRFDLTEVKEAIKWMEREHITPQIL